MKIYYNLKKKRKRFFTERKKNYIQTITQGKKTPLKCLFFLHKFRFLIKSEQNFEKYIFFCFQVLVLVYPNETVKGLNSFFFTTIYKKDINFRLWVS
jgi:hypothetical protein